MRIAYLDCFSGISGDMFLGALVDAGVPFDLLQDTVAALDVAASLELSRVDRNGISASKVDVVVNGKKDMPREEFWAEEQATPHPHLANGHDPEAKTSHIHGRHLSQILKIISAATISATAKSTAAAIFAALGEAEAKVHNVPVEKIHFHEVGAADAIVDIVCAAVGAEALGVDRILASPLNVGGGTVKCAHGVMPIPAPATLELLKGIPVYAGEVQKELVTPTGAAIVRTLARGFSGLPAMTVEMTGYGAGSRNFSGHSNVLRLVVGHTAEGQVPAPDVSHDPSQDEIVILETNLDDLSPQVVAYTADRLLREGALDVISTAVQMKKGRPGVLITVLARPEDEIRLRGILLSETSTLGVRTRHEFRHMLARRHEAVQTPWGEVRIKVGSHGEEISNAMPEYEDCRRLAAEHKVPLKSVMQESLRLYLDKKNG